MYVCALLCVYTIMCQMHHLCTWTGTVSRKVNITNTELQWDDRYRYEM